MIPEVLIVIGTFIVEHGDLISAVQRAIAGGAKKEDVLRAIESSMVTASDAEMQRELGK
jgi:hypothetical protein